MEIWISLDFTLNSYLCEKRFMGTITKKEKAKKNVREQVRYKKCFQFQNIDEVAMSFGYYYIYVGILLYNIHSNNRIANNVYTLEFTCDVLRVTYHFDSKQYFKK